MTELGQGGLDKVVCAESASSCTCPFWHSLDSCSAIMAGHLGCIMLTANPSRLHYDKAMNDYIYVMSVGPKFEFVIPSLDVIAVDLRSMKVQGYTVEGELRCCDYFVRDDPSLDRIYPATMEVTNGTVVEVYKTGIKTVLGADCGYHFET